MFSFNFFAKKKKSQIKKGFVFSVGKVLPTRKPYDVLLAGNITGVAHINDNVKLINSGTNDDTSCKCQVGKIYKTGKGIPSCRRLKNHAAMLYLPNVDKKLFRIGSLLYTDNIAENIVEEQYAHQMFYSFIQNKFTQQEINMLSFTDCCVMWYMYWSIAKKRGPDDNLNNEENKTKIDSIAKAIADKIMLEDSIYYVENVRTSEPYMITSISKLDDQKLICSTPFVAVFPKTFVKAWKFKISEEKNIVKEVVNGPDKKGIYNFLYRTFYLNGAMGFTFFPDIPILGAELIIQHPKYDDKLVISRPVENPDLVRWLLLNGQLGKITCDYESDVYWFYVGFIQKELLNSTLLVPMKHDGSYYDKSEYGISVLNNHFTMEFPVIKNKWGRSAVKMYTDWKRMNESMGEGWEGFIQTIDGMIGNFDCAINLSDENYGGLYLTKEMYDEIKKD